MTPALRHHLYVLHRIERLLASSGALTEAPAPNPERENGTPSRDGASLVWLTCENCFQPMLMSAGEHDAEFSTGLNVHCQSCADVPREVAW